MLLGLQPDNVRVIFRMGAGCYGINGADTVSYDAALLSQAVGKPVRVQLTRKDEMAWENYGFAFVIDQRVGARRRRHDRRVGSRIVVADARRPARREQPGQRRHRVSRRLRAGRLHAEERPAPDPHGFANNSNAVPSYVTGCVGGRCGGTGTIASQRVLTHNVEVAVLHRTAALARTAAEHVRSRIVHGRDRRGGEGRPGRVPPQGQMGR